MVRRGYREEGNKGEETFKTTVIAQSTKYI